MPNSISAVVCATVGTLRAINRRLVTPIPFLTDSDGTPRNTYAYPSSATTAVPDPTGQTGSSSAFQSTSAFDFNTGLISSTTDANQVQSIPEYNDPLMRPTRAVHASGNAAQTQSRIEYDDANHTI